MLQSLLICTDNGIWPLELIMGLLDFIRSLSFCEYKRRDEVHKSCNPTLTWKLCHARTHWSHSMYFLTITNSNMIDMLTFQSVFILDNGQIPNCHKHNTSVEGKITRWRLHINRLSLQLYSSNQWTTGTKDVNCSMMIGRHNLTYTCELQHLLCVNNYKV
jgi:hypothetical protein